MTETIHLSKDDVIAIIAKHFNTYTSEVYIDWKDDVLMYGTCHTDNCGIKPLAIVRKCDDINIDCRNEVDKHRFQEEE